MILLSRISYPSSFTYLSRQAPIKHPSYNWHTYIIQSLLFDQDTDILNSSRPW